MVAKITWRKLIILNILGVSVEETAKVIALSAQVGDEARQRIYQAENGVLVQLRDTDPDADSAVGQLKTKFGDDRVIMLA